jgi:hypothetical protein
MVLQIWQPVSPFPCSEAAVLETGKPVHVPRFADMLFFLSDAGWVELRRKRKIF